MLGNNDPNRNKLKTILAAKSHEVIERFRQTAISGITDTDVISILEAVNTYWKEVYRPALTAFACEAVGGDASSANDAGLMITLAAAGMGIHDDIIDKSEISHFRRTILGRYGNDKALLIGDLLIIKGLTTGVALLQKSFPPEKRDAVMMALQDFLLEIFEGALMDVTCRRNLDTDLDLYSKIIWKLTADGEACTRIGAITGGGTKSEIHALSEFGRRLGFVHHLSEEVKDAMNEEGALPHRLEFESVPLPILYAAKSSRKAFVKIDLNLQKPLTLPSILEITKLCWKSKAFGYTYDLAKANAVEAVEKLDSLRPSPAVDALLLMLNVPLTYLKRARNFENRYTKMLSS